MTLLDGAFGDLCRRIGFEMRADEAAELAVDVGLDLLAEHLASPLFDAEFQRRLLARIGGDQ